MDDGHGILPTSNGEVDFMDLADANGKYQVVNSKCQIVNSQVVIPNTTLPSLRLSQMAIIIIMP